jgi:uncharacterized protein (TIGR00297 family)
VLYAAGGWPWVVLIAVFFATSSALTRVEAASSAPERRSHDRAGRDWSQVVANGGVAGVTALAYSATGAAWCLAACAGAVAAATADTWATEVGRFSKAAPRLITTLASVPHGRSGGVTAIGTAAACAGAVLIASVAGLYLGTPAILAVTAAGVSASLLDSLLGATVEQTHTWAGNNTVNVLATAWGALVAAALVR